MAVNISKFDDRLCGSAYGVGRDAGAWRGQGRRYGVGRGAGVNPRRVASRRRGRRLRAWRVSA